MASVIDIAAAVKLANEVLYAQTMSRHRYDEKARAVAATVIAMAAALRAIRPCDYAQRIMLQRGLTDSGAETP